MKLPIMQGLMEYIQQENVRFHMPGHKGKNSIIEWGKYIPQMDITEVEGVDNLHDPKGIILESQKLASKTFKSKQTFYSVNGTTGGMYIALSAVTNPGDKVLIQRNSHKCIYNAIILNKLNPQYIYPNYNKKYNITTGINEKDIEYILKKDSNIKVVVITYPSYYGVCTNIEKIVEIVHKYGKILVVDEAHGSHLSFSSKLPISSLEAGADIVVQSTHKTLPSFTQTSMIHVGSDRVDIEKLKDMFSLYQTTSPSYILMASLEVARGYMEKEGEQKLSKLLENINKVTSYFKKIDRVNIFDGDKYDETIYDFDITKILINVKGMKGTNLQHILRKHYNIQLEMADYFYGVALSTMMNEKKDFEKLVNAIEDLSKKVPYQKVNSIKVNIQKPKSLVSINEAFYSSKCILPLKESIGKISGSFIIPYPPGIPLVVPGEKITEEIYSNIEFLKQSNIEIIGFTDDKQKYIKVLK